MKLTDAMLERAGRLGLSSMLWGMNDGATPDMAIFGTMKTPEELLEQIKREERKQKSDVQFQVNLLCRYWSMTVTGEGDFVRQLLGITGMTNKEIKAMFRKMLQEVRQFVPHTADNDYKYEKLHRELSYA